MRRITRVLALGAILALTGCATGAADRGDSGAPSPERVTRIAERDAVCGTGGTQAAPDETKCRSKSAARLERGRASQILSGARTGYGGSW